MPQFNTTIEDYSPFISYSSDWRAGTSSSDSLSDLYSDSSFTLTQTDGASASFTFNGTAFTIFGAKRGNHGFFQVTIDGNAFPPANGQSQDPGQFQVPLFSSPVLTQGLHSVILTNQGSTFVDVDFISIENNVGDVNEPLIVNTIQDTDSSFAYTPANVWGTNPPSIGTYSGSTGHGTATPGAFMTFAFQGDAIYLYGPVGPGSSPFSVSLDGGPATNYTANKQFYKPQVLLYSATNLGKGTHEIKVVYQPSQPGQILAVDFANIYTTASLGGVTALTGTSGTNSGSSALSGGAIAAIIIALLFVLFVLAALVFFLRRRRTRRTSLPAPMAQPSRRDALRTSVMAATTQEWRPSAGYPSTVDGSQYYATGANLALDTRSQTYGGSAPSISESSPISHYGGGPIAGTSMPRANPMPSKGQSVPLPPSASLSLSQVPAAELQANRRVVPGRQQDFGPAPPDYLQATEPYPRMV